MRKHYIIYIAALFTSAGAFAQQRADSTMQQSLTLEREFSPIVQKTNKIDRQPAPQPIQESHSQATYAEWEADAVRSSEIDVIPSGRITTPQLDPALGYVQASAGNYVNADVRAGIRKGDFSLDADGLYSVSDLNIMTGNVKATYSHTLGNEAQIETDIKAGGMISELDTPEARKHKGGTAGADVSYENDSFKALLGFDHQAVGSASQNSVNASLRYGIYEKSQRWQAYFDLPARFTFADGSNNYLTVKPTLHLTLLPSGGQWRKFEASIASGTSRPGCYELMQQLPVAMFREKYGTAFDIADATISYEDNEQGHFRWGLSAQARLTNDALCITAHPDLYTAFLDRGTIVTFLPDEDFFIAGEAHVDYEYSRYFGIKAKARYQHHSSLGAALGQPLMVGSVHFVSAPGKVRIDLGVDAGIDRKVPYNNYSDMIGIVGYGWTYNLGDIYDLNFRIDWQINRHFRAFAFGRNLLNRSTELLPLVEAQGINIHGGLRWDF